MATAELLPLQGAEAPAEPPVTRLLVRLPPARIKPLVVQVAMLQQGVALKYLCPLVLMRPVPRRLISATLPGSEQSM